MQSHKKSDISQLRVDRRDTFAAAALTGLLASNPYDHAMTYVEYANESYRMADAMLHERGNHSEKPNSSTDGRGCGGTDKPVTLPAMGTGDIPDSRMRISEAEVDALEYVVEEGRIASMDDYGLLRSLLVRVRPEWESLP